MALNRSSNSGFTLIELMIVVAIIALIAAIVIPSMLRSRINANEVAATAACKTYLTAQEVHRRTDYDNDGVLEYAQNLQGPNSLLERLAGSGDLALIDKSFAAAEGGPTSGMAKSGYVYTVLTGQGPFGTGGARPYITGANMVSGYGLGAVAVSYDGTGRNSFMANQHGTTYQSDRGPVDLEHVLLFDPDPASWTPVE